MKIATIIGVRPEIIKMSRLIPLLDKEFEHTLIFTGQHHSREMADIFFDELNVRQPDKHLLIKSSDRSPLTEAITKTCKELSPDKVIVYGDSNTTYAGALAGKNSKAEVVHIEAGLRSFDKDMPEEYNRTATDKISSILFPPTDLAKHFLGMEGMTKNIFVVGNTIVDVCTGYNKEIEKNDALGKLDLVAKDYILLTVHRQSNVDNPAELVKIIEALGLVHKKIVFPVHPRTRKRLLESKIRLPPNVLATDPMGYFDFLKLMKNSSFVITDSGGVQEEAITLKVPCITMRNNTERWETVEAGGNFLVGTTPPLIEYYAKMIVESDLGKRMNYKNPYGDGRTSERIVEILSKLP